MAPYNLRDRRGVPIITKHAPGCDRYNDSLIRVWKMTVNGVSLYTDSVAELESWKLQEFEDETEIVKCKMHREVFEKLLENDGF